jgi:uncharacterized membrane protein YeaQ/YmgE (transglycosylase-associated protein family)
MQYVWMLFVGLLAAMVAKLILPGQNGPRGVLWTAVIGVAGSFVGSFLGQFFGFYQPGELAGFLGAVVGAAVILLAWDFISRRRQA